MVDCMKLLFIGTDGSLGLKKGETYDAAVIIKDSHIVVKIPSKLVSCPYTTLHNFLSNWEVM